MEYVATVTCTQDPCTYCGPSDFRPPARTYIMSEGATQRPRRFDSAPEAVTHAKRMAHNVYGDSVHRAGYLPYEEGMRLVYEPDPDGFHRISERDDGPDLDDMVRLIRFLREHGIEYAAGDDYADRLAEDDDAWMHVDVVTPGLTLFVHEGSSGAYNGKSLSGTEFIGPDGTVYDRDRKAL